MYLVRTPGGYAQDSAGDVADSDQLASAMDSPAGDSVELDERRRRFQLARVLKVTGEMIDHANSGRWQQVEELELLRRLELETCFALQENTPSALVAEGITTLMCLNDQLVQVVRYARGQLRDSHGAESKAFAAVRAYEEMR